MAEHQPILAIAFAGFIVGGVLGSFALAGEETIRVGIIGDQTGTTDLERAYAVLAEGVGLLQKERPDVVIHVGDLVESSETEASYRKRFEQAVGILDRLQKPWYLVAGDHDTNPRQFQPGSPDRSRETWFKELYGSRNPQAKSTLYYSFDIGPYHFIVLNSQETFHVDPRWGDIFLAQILNEQFRWLEEDLRSHRSAKATVVFLHQPLWYNWIGWKRIHDLLRQYPVAAVIAGHFHYDQDEGELDGIRYVVVGATGGSIKQGHRDAGGVHHVTVMTLTGRRVNFQLLPIGGGQPITLTPRRDMDRVQALHQALGNLQLVNSCPTAGPPIIRITSAGNPLDIPARFHVDLINLEPGNLVQLVESRFAPTLCTNTPSQNECILRAGAGIAIANLSTVSTNFCNLCEQDAEWVWEGKLEFKGQSSRPTGYPLQLKLRVDFEGEQGELFLDRTVETRLMACQS